MSGPQIQSGHSLHAVAYDIAGIFERHPDEVRIDDIPELTAFVKGYSPTVYQAYRSLAPAEQGECWLEVIRILKRRARARATAERVAAGTERILSRRALAPWLRYLVALFVVAAMGQGVVRGCNEGGFEFERQVAAGGSQ
jgi:hypothetical protein